MRRIRRPDWWQTVRTLLSASRSRIGDRWTSRYLFPVVIGLANLFFCTLFEDQIRSDPGGRAMSLFLFIQGGGMMLLTLGHIAVTDTDILRTARVVPVTPFARLLFAFVSASQNRLLQALIVSDVLFFLILFHRSIGAAVLVTSLSILLALDIVALAALGAAAALRRAHTPTAVAAYVTLGMLGIAFAGLLFRLPDAFGLVPPMFWTARGIAASVAGEPGIALLSAAASLVLLLVTVVIGRRAA